MDGLLVWLLLVLGGCGGEPTSAPVVDSVALTPPTSELTIAFQGQGDGEIAPCGCPKNPMGGLTRRNLVLGELGTKGPVVTFETGNSLMPSRADQEEAQQRVIKADLIAASYKLAGIDGLTIGAKDWQLGRKELQQLYSEHDLPVVAANISCEGWDDLPGYRIVERGGWKFGVIGIAAGAPVGCTERDIVESLERGVAATPNVHARIVLWGGEFRAYEGIGDKVSGIDFVLAGQGGAPRPHPLRAGDAWLVLPHMRAKQLSLLQLAPVEGATGWGPEGYRKLLAREEERFRGRIESTKERENSGDEKEQAQAKRQLIYVEKRHKEAAEALRVWDEQNAVRHIFSYSHRTLDKDMEEHPASKELYDAALAKIAALEVKGQFQLVKRIAKGETEFAGSHSCIPCHRAEHLQWSTTPHSRAYQSLIDENRHMDRECYGCHVTGAGHEDGPGEPGAVGPLRDVQCEACHGPSRAHTLTPVDVKPVRSPPQQTCTGCHDGVRDEGRFDWASYLPKVVHGGP